MYATSEYFTGRYVISAAGHHEFRVEIPWAERDEWHDRTFDVLAAHGGMVGANACTRYEPHITMTPEGFTVSGTVSLFLLADKKP